MINGLNNEHRMIVGKWAIGGSAIIDNIDKVTGNAVCIDQIEYFKLRPYFHVDYTDHVQGSKPRFL